MAAPAVVVVWNSRLSGTDAKPLKNVTFSEDLPHLRLHHTSMDRRRAQSGQWLMNKQARHEAAVCSASGPIAIPVNVPHCRRGGPANN